MNISIKPVIYLMLSLLFLGALTPIFLHFSLLTPLFISFAPMPYLLIAFYTVLMGAGITKVMANFGSSWILVSGLLGSTVFSLVLLVQKSIQRLIRQGTAGNVAVSESTGQIAINGSIETNLLWFLAIVFFNIPILYTYLKKENKNWII